MTKTDQIKILFEAGQPMTNRAIGTMQKDRNNNNGHNYNN